MESIHHNRLSPKSHSEEMGEKLPAVKLKIDGKKRRSKDDLRDGSQASHFTDWFDFDYHDTALSLF